jgi:hypothetical protein
VNKGVHDRREMRRMRDLHEKAMTTERTVFYAPTQTGSLYSPTN